MGDQPALVGDTVASDQRRAERTKPQADQAPSPSFPHWFSPPIPHIEAFVAIYFDNPIVHHWTVIGCFVSEGIFFVFQTLRRRAKGKGQLFLLFWLVLFFGYEQATAHNTHTRTNTFEEYISV